MDFESASTKGNSAQGVRLSVAPSSAQIGAQISKSEPSRPFGFPFPSVRMLKAISCYHTRITSVAPGWTQHGGTK